MPKILCLLVLVVVLLPRAAFADGRESDEVLAIRRQRIEQIIPRALASHRIDLWLIFARENSHEPILPTLGLHNTVARSAYLFALEKGELVKIAIAAGYDTSPIEKSGLFDRVIPYGEEGIKPHLKRIVSELAPKRIAVNTARDVTIADGLTLGMYRYLLETLGPGMKKRMVSSQPLVVSIYSIKLPAEIAAIRRAVRVTQDALLRTLSSEFIKPGRTTERDVRDEFYRRVEQAGLEPVFCGVNTGPVRGHAPASTKAIQPGDLIRVDCGARYQGYCSDIQRTAYVLRPGEREPPDQLLEAWQVAKRANRAALAAMKPGVRGVDVDTAGRRIIREAGYVEPPHGSGHAIGFKVHDVGPMLGPDWRERYGDAVFLKLEPGQVFALEPILYMDYPQMGGRINIGLEEDVIVTESGAELMGTTQEEIALIRSK